MRGTPSTVRPRCGLCHFLLASIDLGDVLEEVDDALAVAPLVVVPADQLDEVVVEGDTGLDVDDGAVGIAVQVAGDDVVLGVGEDACDQS